MDQNRHRVYISSKDSKDTHPDNQVSDFVVELPTPLLLDGRWEVALLDSQSTLAKSGKTRMYVCVDLCVESVARGKSVPILAKVPRRGYYESPLTYFTDVRGEFIERIRVFLLDDNLKPLDASGGGDFACSLVFRRVYKGVTYC